MRIVGVSRGQRFSRVGGLHLGLNITRQVRSVSARLIPAFGRSDSALKSLRGVIHF
jgi:hypothetical protein